jgi:hypothetical protein
MDGKCKFNPQWIIQTHTAFGLLQTTGNHLVAMMLDAHEGQEDGCGTTGFKDSNLVQI